MVVLSSLQATRDLLERRGAIYSDRPRFVLLSEMCVMLPLSYRQLTPFQDGVGACFDTCAIVSGDALASLVAHQSLSGPKFRKHRRFINQVFNQKAVLAFRPLQEKEVLILLDGLLHDPDRFVDHFRRYKILFFYVDAIGAAERVCRFAAAVILKITYGHDILSVDDLFIRLGQSSPGSSNPRGFHFAFI
jgi:hypothetical protein